MDAVSKDRELPASAGLLPDVRVLDLSMGIAGPYCAKVLADLGAEVIKVEPLEGDESRLAGPFPGGVPDPEKSARFLAFNANKYGVTLDLATENGRRSLLKLVETTDVVFESTTQPSGFDYETLSEANPRLIMTSITPFGDWGPYARYKATDLVLAHMSGHAAPRKGSGDDEEVPVRASGEQSELVAGLSAATVTLMELYRRRVTGLGCHVIVSAYEAMVNQRFSAIVGRKQADPPAAEQPKPKPAKAPAEVPPYLPCGDGRIVASPRQQAQWERWLEVLGDPEWAQDTRFATVQDRNENRAELWELQSELTRQHNKHDLARIAQEHHVPCFPVNTVVDLLDDEAPERPRVLQEDRRSRYGCLDLPRRGVPPIGRHAAGWCSAGASARSAQRGNPRPRKDARRGNSRSRPERRQGLAGPTAAGRHDGSRPGLGHLGSARRALPLSNGRRGDQSR